MDVNKDNFAEAFIKFESLLPTCKFVSFDEEMTGMFSTGEGMKRDDNAQARYTKMIEVATKYGIIQFGVCLFHETGEGELTATPFNFYVFPNSGSDLVMSPSAIDFLRKNNMDFAQWISKGITFVDKAGEEKLRNKFYPPESDEPKKYIVLTRTSDIEIIDKCMEDVKALMDDEKAIENATSCILQPNNSYLRRVIYEQLEIRYPNQVNVDKNEHGHIVVTKIDPSKQYEIEEKKRIEKEKQFHDALGFRRVYNALISAKKPIVGHNLFFDLLFMYRWLDSALPADFELFRQDLHSKFPWIYDTKYITSLNVDGTKIPDTCLQKCYEHYMKNNTENNNENNIENKKEIQIKMSDIVVGYEGDNAQYHNAGYDAYTTGCVFAKQIYHIQQQNTTTSTTVTTSILTNSSNMYANTLPSTVETACGNTICINRNLYYLQLTPTLPAERFSLTGGTVRITGFDPASTNNSMLVDLLTNAGVKLGDFELLWVDNTAFYVNFPGHEVVGSEEVKEGESSVVKTQLRSTTTDTTTVMDTTTPTTTTADMKETTPSDSITMIEWPQGWVVVDFAQVLAEREAARIVQTVRILSFFL